jgi:hypothetical protein
MTMFQSNQIDWIPVKLTMLLLPLKGLHGRFYFRDFSNTPSEVALIPIICFGQFPVSRHD